MKQRILPVFALLFAFTLPVFAEEVEDEKNLDPFVAKITKMGHVIYIPGDWEPARVVRDDPQELPAVLAEFASPEAFREALRAAWAAEDLGNREFALMFTSSHVNELGLSQDDFQTLAEMVLQKPHARCHAYALEVLVQTGEERFLPVFRKLVADEDAGWVELGVNALTDHFSEKPLPEEDVQRLVKLTKDGRCYIDADHLADDGPGDWPRPLACLAIGKLFAAGRLTGELMREVILPEAWNAYDEAKFARFLEEIEKPIKSGDDFWRLVDETGFLPGKWEYRDPKDAKKTGCDVPKHVTYSPEVMCVLCELEPENKRYWFLLIQASLYRDTDAEGRRRGMSVHYLDRISHPKGSPQWHRVLLKTLRVCEITEWADRQAAALMVDK